MASLLEAAQIKRDRELALALQAAESVEGCIVVSDSPVPKRARRLSADSAAAPAQQPREERGNLAPAQPPREDRGSLAIDAAPASARPPPPAVLRSGLRLESYGTREEPLFVARDVDGHRGEVIKEIVSADLGAAGMQRPEPRRRGERQAVVIEMMRKRGTRHPWRTGLRVEALHAMAEGLLEELSQFYPDVPLLRRRSGGWNDTELLVYNGGGHAVKRHRDVQPQGSLLFIFCAGLASESAAWPDGREMRLRLESGDVMVLDGHTEHAVPNTGIVNTSPFPRGSWLGQRRMAVLVRQRPPL